MSFPPWRCHTAAIPAHARPDPMIRQQRTVLGRRTARIQPVVATPRSRGGCDDDAKAAFGSGRAGALRSPGRPPVARREDRRRFWAAIAAGRSSEDAAVEAGVSPAVGARWFREAGGMPPSHLVRSASRRRAGTCRSPSARRSRSCARKGMGCGRSPAGSARAPSTISRELRRNAATRGGGLEYRATTAQWHADRAARRPKPAKLAVNVALRRYVQERLAGLVVAPDGAAVPGPAVPWKGRRHGRRQDRRWARAWSPEQIARRLPLDFPDDEIDAHLPRGDLPVAVRAGPRRAAPRADRLPAHRPGAARAAGPHAAGGARPSSRPRS